MNGSLIWFAIATIVLYSGCRKNSTSEEEESTLRKADASEPSVPAASAYAARGACRGCHEAEASAWRGSHHDRAMEAPSAATVLGDFGGARFSYDGAEFRFFRRDGAYYVQACREGDCKEYVVKYTFGVEPLQQYLIDMGRGRLQALTVAWDSSARRWFHLHPDERPSPGDALHFTGAYQTWNSMCAECHSTAVRKGYDAERRAYSTTYREIDVGCQSCHGPSRGHAEAPETMTTHRHARSQVETCAPCHSRRSRVSVDADPDESFFDNYRPVVLAEGFYFPDGQIQDEVFVYGSFVQSEMFRRGVQCTHCHDPHSAGLVKTGNALCTRCHAKAPSVPGFEDAAGKVYDSRAHHRHEPGSEAAQCVTCHMPARTYMVVDPRRDHSFPLPRPDLSARLKTPNACNACHADRTPRWAADAITDWFGAARPPHFAQTLARARAARLESEEALIRLAEDGRAPFIVRATALDLLSNYSVKALEAKVGQLGDAHPLVRSTAVDGLERLPKDVRVSAVAPLLHDPVRLVRVEAARVLLSVGAAELPAKHRRAFSEALDELERSQRADADLPGGAFMLGVINEALERPREAETFYLRALDLDPDFLPATLNLASFYNAARRNDHAARTLKAALARHEDNGELYFSLALVAAEQKDWEAADKAFRSAVESMPNDVRVRYNRAIFLLSRSRSREAEKEILEALKLEPDNPDLLYLATTYYAQRQRRREALRYARRLKSVAPNALEPERLVETLDRAPQ